MHETRSPGFLHKRPFIKNTWILDLDTFGMYDLKCVPLLADNFLYSYEEELIQALFSMGKKQ